MSARSPLAPEAFPDLPAVGGVRLATLAAGLRYQRRADLMLAELDPGTTVAGTFTSSRCASAPVEWCRSILDRGSARAVVCNAGNANAFTGRSGETATELTAKTVASALGCDPRDVYLASTGVIGETLDESALADALPTLVSAPSSGWEDAAGAIRTTDTFSKGASHSLSGGWGSPFGKVVGIAKGSGMIAPDMATMLSFVFTDLSVSAAALQQALSPSVEHSYNRITVDSDTSTSDTVLLFATGAAGNPTIEGPQSDGWHDFVEALDQVNLSLAHQIVRDGEGATKFVEVSVLGAVDDESARVIALSIANSPLVKTAIAAEDANWGRIVMAVGKAGEPAERDSLAIWIGNEQVADLGVQLASYSEERATEHLREREITLTVDVGVGEGRARVWTCDLTHGYIDINAGYRS